MKLLSVIIIILFIQGCAFYDVEKNEKTKFLEKTNERISRVVFESGNFIEFTKEGGRYYKLNNCIAGMTMENGYKIIPIYKVSEVATSSGNLSRNEFLSVDTSIVRQVKTQNNDVYKFRLEAGGGKYYKEDKSIIAGYDVTAKFYQVGLDSISYVELYKYNSTKSILVSLGIVAVVGAAVALSFEPGGTPPPPQRTTSSSCPFIYSYDGDKYVFDKEPLGGATASILQRTDLSKLEYLRSSNGKYKLLIRNEMDETEFIDKFKLIYVDHFRGESIYPDVQNNLYLIKNENLPVSVSDEYGKDLLPFFKSYDGVFWKSKMPGIPTENNKTRNEILFSFIKPKSANHCNLILDAGTTIWGSHMVKEMLLLYGNNVDSYYKSINTRGEGYNTMMNFLQKEELYQLKLYAKVHGNWEYKTTIIGAGPFKTESRVYPIDISDIEGDTLSFKVDPPVGFWTFDYAAVDFNPIVHPESVTLDISKAIDNNSTNIESLLNKEDKNYYTMPDTSNSFYSEFNSPSLSEGKVRTIFASTTGWYQIHLPKTGKANMAQLFKFVTEPGSIVKYSNNKFMELINRNNEVK